jgi:HNH endonuclease
MDDIKHSELLRIIHYEPITGVFRWLVAINKKAVIGRNVGGVNKSLGYVVLGIAGKRYYAHRLAWFYMTGAWPDMIDHRDGDGLNNKWENLRIASKRENAMNSKKSATNKSGYKGVSWHIGAKKWQSFCGPQYIGLFDTAEQAHAAYMYEAKKTGFERAE